MKKFFIGLFACLVAVFGSIASIGSKSSFNNFNEFKTGKNAIVYNENDKNIKIFLDPTLDYNTSSFNRVEIFSYQSHISLNNFYYYDLNYNKIEFNNLLTTGDEFYVISVYFSANVADYLDSQIGFFIDDLDWVIVRDNGTNVYKFYFNNNYVSDVLGFEFDKADSIEPYNSSEINLFIGDITSLPSPPSPPSQNFLDDITNTINGVIDWFVDLFNGLTDIFINIDSNGNFLGFTLWGNVLFIEVAIMLVMIALRWVISLIRGI